MLTVQTRRQAQSLLCAALLSCASVAALGGDSLDGACSVESAKAATTAKALSDIVSTCDGDAWSAAIVRLFRFPLPEPPRLVLSAAVPLETAEQVTYETEVFYYVFQPYPPPEAFEKLNQLLTRLSKSFYLISISLTGTVDSVELQTAMASDLASTRARRVQEYLEAAGANPRDPVQISVAHSVHSDTRESRALARTTKIKVVGLRAKASP